MKVIIADSKGWFNLKPILHNTLEVKVIRNKSELSYNLLEKFNPDFLFFTHWSWIVPKKIHKKYSCVVFHTAPLPYGRGGSPIQNLIINGFNLSYLYLRNKLISFS